MSLLQRIAERNAGRQSEMSATQTAAADEAAKPNASDSQAKQRADYSGAVAAGPDQDLQDEEPTPEEQAQFTQVEKALTEAVYNGKASDALIDAVRKAPDPVEGVGKAANDLVRSLTKKFPDMGDDVMFAIGESAVEQIVDLVESASPDIDLSEDQMAEAFSIGVSSWMEGNPNAVDPQMKEYMQGAPPAQL